MKKKLEAELISLAHRILKLKNKSELTQLQEESRKLYEKLSVLLFVEENFSGAQPTIGRKEAAMILEDAFEKSEDKYSDETLDVQEEIGVEAEKQAENENVAADTEEEVVEVSSDDSQGQPKSREAEEENAEEVNEVKGDGTSEEIISDEQLDESEDNSEEEKVVVGKIELSDDDLDEEEPTVFEDEENVSIEEVEGAVDDEISTLEPEDIGIPKSLVPETPHFELAFDKKEDVEEVAKESGHQIIFEDFLGDHYKDLEFVKAEIEQKEDTKPAEDKQKTEEIESFKEDEQLEKQEDKKEENKKEATKEEPKEEVKQESQNPAPEKVTKGITIGLNDRVGFVNNLFGGSNEDFNRVLSQLNTFDTFKDAKNFIEDLVKPDYNEWKGKEDYEERFLEVVENKFK